MKTRSILALLLLIIATTAAFAEQKSGRRTVVIRDGKVITDNVEGDLEGIPFADLEMLRGKRAYLGVSLIDLTSELREHFGASKSEGVLVGTVEEGGPADKTGIRVGDIIVSVDGKDVASSSALRKALADKKDGESVRIEVLRGRARQTFVASVVEREGPSMFRIGENIDIRGLPELRSARIASLPNCVELQSKLRELETKMKELEKKLQK